MSVDEGAFFGDSERDYVDQLKLKLFPGVFGQTCLDIVVISMVK